MTPEELTNWLIERHHPIPHEIVDYVFNSPDQNHLMFSDYEGLTESSPFEIVFLKGYDFYNLQQVYASSTTAKTFQCLLDKYPADRNRCWKNYVVGVGYVNQKYTHRKTKK